MGVRPAPVLAIVRRRQPPAASRQPNAPLLAAAFLSLALGGCGNTAPMEESARDDVSRRNAEGVAALSRGDLDGAEERFARALALGRAIDDLPGQARALHNLALAHRDRRSFDLSLEEVRLSEDLFREAGDREGEARAAAAAGGILLAAGKLDAAREAFDRALSEALGAPDAIRAEVLTGLSSLHLAKDDAGLAWEAAREAASLAGDDAVRADALSNMAQALCRGGDFPGARKILLEVLDLDRAADRRGKIADTLRLLAMVAGMQGDREAAARFEERWRGVSEALEGGRGGGAPGDREAPPRPPPGP